MVNNAIVKSDIRYHIKLTNKGMPPMPAYAHILDQDAIKNIAAFERNAWGNHDYQIFEK